jgi:threonine aldolase
VVGSRDFIWRARRARKLLGGGLRQVGVLAAPGIIALQDGSAGMIERLEEDHVTARQLADGLVNVPGIRDLDPERVRTDFVMFRVADRPAFLDGMAREGVLMVPYPHGYVRAVTHLGIDASHVTRTISVAARVLGASVAAPTYA